MKRLNMLANREFLLLVAIVASAITMHVRQHVTTQTPPSRIEYGRMCAPSGLQDGAKNAHALPADCDMRTNVRTPRPTQTWV